MIAVILSWAGYLGVRYLVMVKYFGMHDTYKPGEFSEMLINSLQSYGLKFFWGLEGLWLIILTAILLMIYKF